MGVWGRLVARNRAQWPRPYWYVYLVGTLLLLAAVAVDLAAGSSRWHDILIIVGPVLMLVGAAGALWRRSRSGDPIDGGDDDRAGR
jgi:protein-S-isoprenylcysteine O-methyltransferase Ste14